MCKRALPLNAFTLLTGTYGNTLSMILSHSYSLPYAFTEGATTFNSNKLMPNDTKICKSIFKSHRQGENNSNASFLLESNIVLKNSF